MPLALAILLAGACANEDDDEQRRLALAGDSVRVRDLSDAEVASLLRFIDGTELAGAREILPKLVTAPARAYAQLLIDDHTRMRAATAELTPFDDSSAAPPQFTTLRAVTHSQASTLMTLPAGRAFDATFLGLQAGTHAALVDSLRAWRNSVEDEGLRRAVDAMIPLVDAHRERALVAFAAVQGADTTPLRPPVARRDSAGPRHVAPPGRIPPDSTAPAE